MDAAKKGVKAPMVKATCENCGAQFERSAYHPYVKLCPECKKRKKPAAPQKDDALVVLQRRGEVELLRNLAVTDGYGLRVGGKLLHSRSERGVVLAEYRRLVNRDISTVQNVGRRPE